MAHGSTSPIFKASAISVIIRNQGAKPTKECSMKLARLMPCPPPPKPIVTVKWEKRNELALEYAKLLITRPEPLRPEEVASCSFAIADAMVDRMYEE